MTTKKPSFPKQQAVGAVSAQVVDRVKGLRRRRGMTAAQLGEAMTTVGVPWSRSLVANLECGRRETVTVDELLGLADVLHVTPAYLLGASEAETDALHASASNHAAVTATLKSLAGAGRLAAEHQALVTLCLKLAKSVDAYPDNASLWREYRAAVTELTKVGADDAGDPDQAAALAAAMSAAMRNPALS